MSHPTNENRADWADSALAAFAIITRCDTEDALPDLLCNLMHYAGQNGIDFNAMLQRARSNFEAEIEEEAEDSNPFDPESPEGRAWASGDRSSVETVYPSPPRAV